MKKWHKNDEFIASCNRLVQIASNRCQDGNYRTTVEAIANYQLVNINTSTTSL
ncbi:hypothetical protein [Nostoc sp.]|uniref:hypothetical protein n=1 Tax=Nostoc sp. TaxID=1180 RepID=UPI002FFC5A6A